MTDKTQQDTGAAKRRGVRGFGSMKGEIWMVSDEEMKKVDQEIADMFEQSVIFPEEKAQPGGGRSPTTTSP